MTTSVEERNRLLDELKDATDEWYEAEAARINDEVTFLKSVLRGRTGSERVAASNTTQARVLLVTDITTFLAGES